MSFVSEGRVGFSRWGLIWVSDSDSECGCVRFVVTRKSFLKQENSIFCLNPFMQFEVARGGLFKQAVLGVPGYFFLVFLLCFPSIG